MNVPEFWHQLVTDLDRANPAPTNQIFRNLPAVVTGGCVRDWFLGIPVKDIDIYVGRHAGLTRETVNLPDGWAIGDEDQTLQEQWQDYAGNPLINSIGNYVVNDMAVQVMYLNCQPWQAMQQFDQALSRGSYTTESGLTLSPSFLKDVRQQTITVYNNTERSLQRAERLYNKFVEHGVGSFTIVTPQPEATTLNEFF